MMQGAALLLLLAAATASAQTTQLQPYTGAVVSYTPLTSAVRPSDRPAENVAKYSEFIRDARSKGAKIVVFPEYGLTGLDIFAGDGPVYANVAQVATALPPVGGRPCDMSDREVAAWLRDLSCYATNIIVVAHVVEAAGARFHSTIVVFNSTGHLAAAHRKHHLAPHELGLFSSGRNESHPDAYRFTTFNAHIISTTFGVLSGDELFWSMGRDLLERNREVTDVVVLSAAKSQLPMRHGLSQYAAYAYAHGVNLLVAQLVNVTAGSTGSGLFRSDGGQPTTRVPKQPTWALLDAVLPNIRMRTPSLACDEHLQPRAPPQADTVPDGRAAVSPPHIADRMFKQDMRDFTFERVDSNALNFSQRVCSGSFCCEVSGAFSQEPASFDEDAVFKVGAYSGIQYTDEYRNVTYGYRMCGLFACATADDCTRPAYATRSIDLTRLAVRVPDVARGGDNGDVYGPLLLDYNLDVAAPVRFCRSQASHVQATFEMTLAERTRGLQVFGVYGRVYRYDGLPVGARSGATAPSTATAAVLLLAAGLAAMLRA